METIKYVATMVDDVIVSKGMNHTDYVDEKEIELTEEEYNTISIPCKKVNGEYVPCEFPSSAITETPTSEPEPTTEELLNIILGVEE